MTDEEKFDMYMKVPHEMLVRMKIEEEKYVAMLEDQVGGKTFTYRPKDLDDSTTTLSSCDETITTLIENGE